MVVGGTILTLLIAGTAYSLGVMVERDRQEKRIKRYYIRRCRLTAREVKHGFFKDSEPEV